MLTLVKYYLGVGNDGKAEVHEAWREDAAEGAGC